MWIGIAEFSVFREFGVAFPNRPGSNDAHHAQIVWLPVEFLSYIFILLCSRVISDAPVGVLTLPVDFFKLLLPVNKLLCRRKRKYPYRKDRKWTGGSEMLTGASYYEQEDQNDPKGSAIM